MSKSLAPDAVRLVPVEPTEAMLDAVSDWPICWPAFGEASAAQQAAFHADRATASSIYRAMLAAAPAPATARGGDALRIAVEALEKIRLESEDCLGLRMETITGIADHALAALASQPQATGGAVERERHKALSNLILDFCCDMHVDIPVETHDALASLILATQPAHSPGGWQDISTAPKDERWLLTFGCLHSGGEYAGETPTTMRSRWDEETSSWYSIEWGGHEPTHWQPLPAAPSIQKGGGA